MSASINNTFTATNIIPHATISNGIDLVDKFASITVSCVNNGGNGNIIIKFGNNLNEPFQFAEIYEILDQTPKSISTSVKSKYLTVVYENGNNLCNSVNVYTALLTGIGNNVDVNLNYETDSVSVYNSELNPLWITNNSETPLFISGDIQIGTVSVDNLPTDYSNVALQQNILSNLTIFNNQTQSNLTAITTAINNLPAPLGNTGYISVRNDGLLGITGSVGLTGAVGILPGQSVNISNTSDFMGNTGYVSVRNDGLLGITGSVGLTGAVGILPDQSVAVSNQITGYSLETTQQDILNTVSNPPTATLILDSPEGIQAYADTVPPPVIDTYKRKGWYYTNTSAGNKYNYYFYSNGNYTQTLADITGNWCICENDSTTTTASDVIPIMAVYTVGSLNVWYQSKRVYSANARMVAGMKYLFYWGVEPTVFPELPRIQLTLKSENGTLLPGETVLTMSVGSESSASAGTIRNLMTHIGWRNSSNEFITQLISDANFISTDVRILDKLSTGIAVSGTVNIGNTGNFFGPTGYISVRNLDGYSGFTGVQTVNGTVNIGNTGNFFGPTGYISVRSLDTYSGFTGVQTVNGTVNIGTMPTVEVNNFSTSGLAKEITLGAVYTTLGGIATGTTTIAQNTGRLSDCVDNGIYNLGVKIRESSAVLDVSNVAFNNLSNLNIPVSYINSNIILTNSNLSILSGAVADNKFQCSLSDNQKIVINGGSVGISGGSVGITGLVEVSNIALSNIDIPISQINSNIVLGNSNLSILSSAVADNKFQCSLSDNQKVVINGGSVGISGGSVGITGLIEVSNIALSNIDIPMSYINSNVNGLSSCVNEANLNVRMYGSSDGSSWHHIKTNQAGVIHTHLETVASGALSATVSSGVYNALDVSVKNASLPVNSVGSGSWGNAVNNGSLVGSQYTASYNISSSAYVYVIYRDGSTGVFDSILVEWSFDNSNWYYLGDSIFPSTPQGQQYRQGTLNDKRKYGWNYMRFKNNGNSSLSSVYITVLGSSI
jgi:hypothetical protein